MAPAVPRGLIVLLWGGMCACDPETPSAPVAPAPDVDSAAPDPDSDEPDLEEPPFDTHLPGPWTVTVAAAWPTLVADGVATTTFELGVTDPEGGHPDDGTVLRLTSDLGAITAITPLAEGRASATFRAGTWPGTATLALADPGLPGATLVGDTALVLIAGTPTSVQLHLHGSLSEGDGTMLEHLSEAEIWGVDTLWWTDHDFGYYPDHTYEVTGFDFESGALEYEIPGWPSTTVHEVAMELVGENTLASPVSEVSADAARSGAYGWRIAGSGADPSVASEAMFQLTVAPRINFKPLLGDVSLSLAFRPQHDVDDAELWVIVPLSASGAGDTELPDDYLAVYLYHSSHDYTALSDDTHLYLPMAGTVGTWSVEDLDLSGLLAARRPLLRNDLHAEMITVGVRAWNGTTAAYDLDDLSWTQEIVGDELRDVQRAFLDDTPTSVVQLVGQEVSFLEEGHFNAFGEALPFLPYADSDDWDAASAAEFFHASGGIVSYNHMFGVGGGLQDEEARAVLVAEQITELTESRVWGCDLLEVGYRSRVGGLDDFFQVWDALSVNGIFITGEGASDIHDEGSWRLAPNAFVTWVPVATVDEDELMRNLVRGMAWFGDPTEFDGGDVAVSLTVPEERAVMGQVVVGRATPATVRFTADPLQADWVVRAVVDGEVAEEWVVGQTGPFEAEHRVDPVGGAVVRFEVWTLADSGLLFTNPIWFADTVPDGLPEDRIPAP